MYVRWTLPVNSQKSIDKDSHIIKVKIFFCTELVKKKLHADALRSIPPGISNLFGSQSKPIIYLVLNQKLI